MAFNFNSKIDTAIELYDKGKLQKSLRLCNELLAVDSSNPYVLITLGNIYYVQNNYKKASDFYQNAVDFNPENYSATINLANSYYELKNYLDAVYYAKNAIKQKPEEKIGYVILGNSYFELENYADSIIAFEQALKIDPSDVWVYNYLSQSYNKANNYIKAVSNGWKAVELSYGKDDAHHLNLGYIFYEIALEKDADSIADCIKLWHSKYANNSIVRYMGNALLKNQKIKTADPKYLQNIFDVFASDFDSVLSSLDYRAPALINGFLKDMYKKKDNPRLKILDLGCGTGLCGEFLQKYAGWRGLRGVDISAKMIAAAKAKKLYTHLYNADILSFLKPYKKSYDLMVAADVFTYIGELDSLFSTIAKSLRKKGRIIFTVTENNINDSDYYLHISGRFLHSIKYIQKVLSDKGLELEKCDYKKLRNEGENIVMGYVILAVKKS